jgi:predicted amidohydrolase YtcJ
MRIDRRQLLAGAAAAGFGSLGFRQAALAAPGRGVDTAFVNGRIWTGESADVVADALGISGGRVVALGREAVTALSGMATRVVDLGGAFITPGFIDPHVHFTLAALQLGQPVLRNAKGREEFTDIVARAAQGLAPGQWITGGNWDNDGWGGELPTRDWIDSVTPETAVAVLRYDLHMVLMNSRALSEIGVDETLGEIEGGVIGRDANGRLTGIFKDAAKEFVIGKIPKESDAAIDAANQRALQMALGKGVTQICETGVDWRTFHSARRLGKAGQMAMRVNAMVPLADWAKLSEIVRTEGTGSEWVRWSGCKVVFDGSLGSRTALFYERYLDDPTTRGIVVTERADMFEWALAADAAGLQVAAHAIGDEANDTVLDVFAQIATINGSRDRRFRIEHAQHLRPEALPRFAKQGVVASVQPYHAVDDGRWAVRRIGPERLETTYAFQSLLQNGAQICFGSDWPVAPIDPLTGLAAAVARRTLDGEHPEGWYPRQKVTIGDALLAYTRGGAYATMRDDTGQLTPGKLADFVLWDRDLTQLPAEEITSAQALETWVGGERRHG